MLKWKTDSDGNRVLTDGLPVIVTEDGKEEAFDLDRYNSTLATAKSQAASRRDRISALEPLETEVQGMRAVIGEDLDAFTTELDELRKAKRKLDRLAKGKDADAGGEDLDVLNDQVYQLGEQVKALEVKYTAADALATERGQSIEQLTVGTEFQRSPWFNPWADDEGNRRQPKTGLDSETAQLKFGAHFRPGENGKGVVAAWTPGGKDIVMSPEDGSKPANFDEAIGLLGKKWDKWSLYLPTGEPGGMRSRESGGDGDSGAGTLNRTAFDRLSPSEKTTFMKKGGKVTEATR